MRKCAILVAILVAAVALLAYAYFDLRKKYRDAVLSSVALAWNSTRLARVYNRDGDFGTDPGELINNVLSCMRVNRMYDRKTAIIISDIDDNLNYLKPSISPENLNYIKSVRGKWRGKSLGFPDKW